MRLMLLRTVTLLALSMVVFRCAAPPATPASGPRVLLAIFAHPDDEATVSAVLAKYAAEGVRVYLAVATDGRHGVAEHAGIPAGDSLAHVRTRELACAAEKLGIEKPIQFGLHDQMKMQEGFGTWGEQVKLLYDQVAQTISTLQPDVILTWGPSGWTGHHDHRIVGAVVTEVFQSRKWDKPIQLYYGALPSGSIPTNSPMQLATVDERFLPTRISLSEADYAKAKASWLCHESQYRPETIDQMHQMLTGAQKGNAYFQPVGAYTVSSNSLF